MKDVAFGYHTRYRLDYIERVLGAKATRDHKNMSGVPGLVSVVDRHSGDQYDFCGIDDDNLVLLWINDERKQQKGA